MTTSLFGMEFCKRGVQRSPEGIHIADLFSFLISFALKKEEQESSLDFVTLFMSRERLFSLDQRTKVCFMSFRVTLTPATILCRTILENANAFSVHVTGFKHKIYRWLCFAVMRDLESGTDQERIQDRAFSIHRRK
jgi:hypothetical protein